jgi:hypothetical protein
MFCTCHLSSTWTASLFVRDLINVILRRGPGSVQFWPTSIYPWFRWLLTGPDAGALAGSIHMRYRWTGTVTSGYCSQLTVSACQELVMTDTLQ